MDHDALISEARARIVWGESRPSVCEFLTSNGISESEAGARIREFQRERNGEVRRLGIQSVLIGTLVVSLAGILLYLGFGGPEFGGDIHGLAVAIAAGIYGIWKLTKGGIYLLRPQAEDGSIGEMGE